MNTLASILLLGLWHSARARAVVIVMSDSRNESVEGYHKMAIEINRRHAKRHNATFTFVHTPCLNNDINEKYKNDAKHCIACVHPVHGPRATSWCKLKAINASMNRFANHSRFVYMDSDAVFRRPLKEEFWSEHISMFTNYPWTDQPFCAGVQLWTRNKMSQHILNAWWDASDNEYNVIHDFEQHPWHPEAHLLYDTYAKYVHVIGEKTLVDEPNQTIVHIGHNREDKRLPAFSKILSAM